MSPGRWLAQALDQARVQPSRTIVHGYHWRYGMHSLGVLRHRKPAVAAVTLWLLALWFAFAPSALAGAGYQPVEWERYINGHPKYSISLVSLLPVKGCKPDQPNNWDYKYRININASYDPDRYRIYSDNSWGQRIFSGSSPMGVLNTGSPYLCVGQRASWEGGTPLLVQTYLYVWIK